MDWQLGDVLQHCHAGDIRVYYTVADPKQLSVLGQAARVSNQGAVTVDLYRDSRGTEIGLAYPGVLSYIQMMDMEVEKLKWNATLVKCGLALFGAGLDTLVGLAGVKVPFAAMLTLPAILLCRLCVYGTDFFVTGFSFSHFLLIMLSVLVGEFIT